MSTTDAVLTVIELAQYRWLAAGGLQMDALRGFAGNEGVGTKDEGKGSESVLHFGWNEVDEQSFDGLEISFKLEHEHASYRQREPHIS